MKKIFLIFILHSFKDREVINHKIKEWRWWWWTNILRGNRGCFINPKISLHFHLLLAFVIRKDHCGRKQGRQPTRTVLNAEINNKKRKTYLGVCILNSKPEGARTHYAAQETENRDCFISRPSIVILLLFLIFGKLVRREAVISARSVFPVWFALWSNTQTTIRITCLLLTFLSKFSALRYSQYINYKQVYKLFYKPIYELFLTA